MLQELRRLAVRATERRYLLAYHLVDLRVDEICWRLDCTVVTAYLILLSNTPRLLTWQADVRRLAELRKVPYERLAALLLEAEAIVWGSRNSNT